MTTITDPAVAAERAARWVPSNPHYLCRDFSPKPAPSEFWCATCGWNETLHADEVERTAIAAEMDRQKALAEVSDFCSGYGNYESLSEAARKIYDEYARLHPTSRP